MAGELSKYCDGCSKIENDKCTVYVDPVLMMRWVDNPSIKAGCAFNKSNLIKSGIISEGGKGSSSKVRAGQQKQKKRK